MVKISHQFSNPRLEAKVTKSTPDNPSQLVEEVISSHPIPPQTFIEWIGQADEALSDGESLDYRLDRFEETKQALAEEMGIEWKSEDLDEDRYLEVNYDSEWVIEEAE